VIKIGDVEKVYVCGPPAMNHIIPVSLKKLQFDSGKIIII